MNNLGQFIQNYFAITPEEGRIIESLFQPERLEKGDFYTKKGLICGKLSFIKSGLIRVYAPYEDKDITQWVASPGEFIAEMGGLIFQQESRFTIQCLTDCELYTLSASQYEQLALRLPRWHLIEKRFIAKCFMMLEARVFQHLSLSAEERYLQLMQHQKELLQEVPLQHLASMLGMSAETLSRIRAKRIS